MVKRAVAHASIVVKMVKTGQKKPHPAASIAAAADPGER